MKKFTFKGVLDGFRSSVQTTQQRGDKEIEETLRPADFTLKKVSFRWLVLGVQLISLKLFLFLHLSTSSLSSPQFSSTFCWLLEKLKERKKLPYFPPKFTLYAYMTFRLYSNFINFSSDSFCILLHTPFTSFDSGCQHYILLSDLRISQ